MKSTISSRPISWDHFQSARALLSSNELGHVSAIACRESGLYLGWRRVRQSVRSRPGLLATMGSHSMVKPGMRF